MNDQKFIVRFSGLPVKFQTIGLKSVSTVVPATMATIFPNRAAALDRSKEQWGNPGFEYVEICDASAPYTPRQRGTRADPRQRTFDTNASPKERGIHAASPSSPRGHPDQPTIKPNTKQL